MLLTVTVGSSIPNTIKIVVGIGIGIFGASFICSLFGNGPLAKFIKILGYLYVLSMVIIEAKKALSLMWSL